MDILVLYDWYLWFMKVSAKYASFCGRDYSLSHGLISSTLPAFCKYLPDISQFITEYSVCSEVVL